MLTEVLRGRASAKRARKEYVRHMEGGTSTFFRLIRQYYEQSFRDLFLNGTGPYQMHRAVLAALAGHVFPKPAWPVRWRLWLFNFHVWLNRHVALVPRHGRFSLLNPTEHQTPDSAAAAATPLRGFAIRGA
jgi:hypothetical protein